MCSALGGRAAEELIFNQISTGALNDLEKVTRQAYAMVSYFGMSTKVGNISFFDSSGQSEYSFHKPYSEKTAELIDHEASAIVEEQYNRAKKILTENKEKHSKLAELLLEKEVIFSEDLEKIFGKRKGPQHVIPSNGGSNEGDSAEKNDDAGSKSDKQEDAKSEGGSESKDKNDSDNKE
jgi:cell division protease FtsH